MPAAFMEYAVEQYGRQQKSTEAILTGYAGSGAVETGIRLGSGHANNTTTTKEVAAAVSALGLRATGEMLSAISRNCRNDFLAHLSRCTTGQDSDGASRKFISNLIRCLSPNTLNRIKSIYPRATFDMIASVARAYPIKFLSAIDAAHDPEHARHADAKEYLASIFAHAQDQSRDAQPPFPLPRRLETAAQDKPTSENGKKFYSEHVYGSNAALCFNATDWDGAPGVMVDAALQCGPKSYDWRNATHIWLNSNEVGAVLAVFRRWRKSVEFSAHGAKNDKSFSIEFQDRHFFAKVTSRKAESGGVRAVKILPSDAMAISVLFLRQLAECYPTIPLSELLATVRSTFE